MLKGIDPLLGQHPDLLATLARMGHDDALVLADANFTAERLSGGRPVLRWPGISLMRALAAVTSVLPLVEDEIYPAALMHVSGQPDRYRSALQREVMAHMAPLLRPEQQVESVERFAFYDRARAAFAIVVTGEMQPFGNLLLRKGVVGENLRS